MWGFMAKIKLKSSVAKCGETKTDDALIDSGGSHHFFHSKKYFNNYQKIDVINVQAEIHEVNHAYV